MGRNETSDDADLHRPAHPVLPRRSAASSISCCSTSCPTTASPTGGRNSTRAREEGAPAVQTHDAPRRGRGDGRPASARGHARRGTGPRRRPRRRSATWWCSTGSRSVGTTTRCSATTSPPGSGLATTSRRRWRRWGRRRPVAGDGGVRDAHPHRERERRVSAGRWPDRRLPRQLRQPAARADAFALVQRHGRRTHLRSGGGGAARRKHHLQVAGLPGAGGLVPVGVRAVRPRHDLLQERTARGGWCRFRRRSARARRSRALRQLHCPRASIRRRQRRWTSSSARRRSVLDLVHQRTPSGSFRSSDAADQLRLQRHFDEIRDLELRVAAIAAPADQHLRQACGPRRRPGAGREPGRGRRAATPPTTRTSATAARRTRAKTLLRPHPHGLVCDLTRVASLQLTMFQSHMNMFSLTGQAL